MKADLIYVHGQLIIRFLKIKRAPQFDASEKKEIESFIKERHLEIVQKWEDFFVLGKKPTFDKIKVKLKRVKKEEKKKENKSKK